MSESRHIEYRIVWPNGYVYASKLNRDLVYTKLRDIHMLLRETGVPNDYWPRKQARIVNTTSSEWLDARAAEELFATPPDEKALTFEKKLNGMAEPGKSEGFLTATVVAGPADVENEDFELEDKEPPARKLRKIKDTPQA